MKQTYKFDDLSLYFDTKTGEIFVTISDVKPDYVEDYFVRDARTMDYTVEACSVACVTTYKNLEDQGRWVKISKLSATERLLGTSFDKDQTFTMDELKALELSLNLAHKQAYTMAFVTTEDGAGDFDCIKKDDLLFAVVNEDGYMFREANGEYRFILTKKDDGSMSDTKIVITPKGTKTTTDREPVMHDISLGERYYNPYGVFPNRDVYLDTMEYPGFSVEAYRKFLELKKQKEAEGSNPSGMGE